MEKIAIDSLELHPDIQSREELDMVVIQEYADLMHQGIEFPPIEVVQENSHNWVWDGFHRTRAAQSASVINVWANVEPGTFQDAQWKAAGANIAHGLRRTNADKRKAVERALKAEPNKSDNEIARHCGVANSTVSSVRSAISLSFQFGKIDSRTVTRGGTTYTQDITNIGKAKTIEPEPSEQSGVLSQWVVDAASYPEAETGEPSRQKPKPVFNRTNENIEWAAWSWNPVTGCKHGCPYCYARDIANRFFPQRFEPTFHPERLTAPQNTKPIQPRQDGDIGHKGVFVCSMADLFGDWVPQEWIDAVLETVATAPQWEFLFLTKNPKRLVGVAWPDNAWVGTTVDVQKRVAEAECAFAQIEAKVKFLSCEPLRGDLVFSSLDMFDWVIVGGQSKSTQMPAFQPPWEWVENLCNQARQSGCKIYFKPNLESRPREYPVFGNVEQESW